MSRPVDVLAVMDRFANTVLPVKLWDGRNPYCGSPGREGSEYQNDLVALTEARAAVAELVEKSDEAWKLLHNALNAGQLDARYAWIAADLHAALAKFSGDA